MEGRGQASEDKVCYTCGHAGFADSIATCSRCKVSHVHTYCMSFVRYEVPKEWRCEECLRSSEAVTNKRLRVPQFWHKRISRKIVAGKVKFITNEEVVTLASGKGPHGRGNPSASGHHSDFACVNPPSISWRTAAPTLPSPKAVKSAFVPKKEPVYAGVDISPSELAMASIPINKEKGRETAAQVCKMKTVEGKANALAYNFSATCTKPKEVRFVNVDSLHTDDGHTSMVDKHIENKKPLKPPQHDSLIIEELANASLAFKEEMDLQKKRDANVLPVHDSGTAVCSIPQFSQILSPKMLLPLKLIISSDEKHHHTVEACWRGDFEVLDLVNQFHGTVHAHLSCQVSPKVYDISKHFPEILQFKMLSRESVWPKIFKLSPPTKDDVALYFRCELERHKKNYAHFIQHIDSHDYALQGCVEDVELLLFTYAQLQIDSQKFCGDIYLWGVFRHVKRKKASHAEEKAVPCSPSTPTVHLSRGRSKFPLDVSSLEVDMKVDFLRASSLEKEVDMEIDMVGGCSIGKIDVPIKLEDAPSGFSKPIQRSPVNFSIKKSTNSHFLDSPPGFPVPAYKRSVLASPGNPTKDPVSSNTTRKYGYADPTGN